MVVHELGHILAAYLTGGGVTKVVLHPLDISRTDVSPNPQPVLVVWAGPVLGVMIPLVIWGVFCKLRIPGDYLARFFAGFCLIANGGYIAIGSFESIGDAGDMLRYGSGNWQLWLFGIVTIPPGFLLWHRLGPRFGLGEANGQVNSGAAWLSLGMFVFLFFVMLVGSPRF